MSLKNKYSTHNKCFWCSIVFLTVCFVVAALWFELVVGKTNSTKFDKVISQRLFANESNNSSALLIQLNDTKIEKITINNSNEIFPPKQWLADEIFLSQNDKDIASLAECPYHLTQIVDNLYEYCNGFIKSFVANKEKLIYRE